MCVVCVWCLRVRGVCLVWVCNMRVRVCVSSSVCVHGVCGACGVSVCSMCFVWCVCDMCGMIVVCL